MENLIQTVEAIIFSAGTEIKKKDILDKLEGVTRKQLNDAIRALSQRYKGDRGVLLVEFNDYVQFTSNPAYGDVVSDVLRPIRQKALSDTLLQVLAIIAYKQPITRGEIEEIRGNTSADYALTTLTRAGLIRVSGHRNTPGRPWLYVTTNEFLRRFQLRSLNDLPEYKDVMKRLMELGTFAVKREELFKEVNLAEDFTGEVFSADDDETDALNATEKALDAALQEEEELPEFLKGEDVQFVSGEDEEEKAEAAADIADSDEDFNKEDNDDETDVGNDFEDEDDETDAGNDFDDEDDEIDTGNDFDDEDDEIDTGNDFDEEFDDEDDNDDDDGEE